MLKFVKKYAVLISILSILIILTSWWLFPSLTFMLAITFLLLTLSISVWFIFEKHKAVDPKLEARRRIARDSIILVLATIAVFAFGELAGLFAGHYAGTRWPDLGVMVSIIAAILASFAVGFLVRWGMLRATRSWR